MPEKMHFRVNGHDLELSQEDVRHKLSTLKAQPVRKYYIRYNNRKFPVNQVLTEVSGGKLLKSEVATKEAVRVFLRLGLRVREEE